MEAFLIGLLVVILGVAFTFAGYQFFRILIPIWGFFAGFIWGAQAVAVGLGTGFLATLTGWVVGLLVALAFAALAYLFYELAVGVLAGSIGYWLTMAFLTAIGFAQGGFLATIISFAVALAVGIAVIYISAPKGILIGLSAFGGATATIGGLLVMFGVVPVALLGSDIVTAIISQSFFWIVVWAALAVGGIITQLEISRTISEEMEYESSNYSAASYGYGSLAGMKGGSAQRASEKEEIVQDADEEDVVEVTPEKDTN